MYLSEKAHLSSSFFYFFFSFLICIFFCNCISLYINVILQSSQNVKAASCVPVALLSQSCLVSSGSVLLGSYRLCCAGCGSAQTCATRNLLQSVFCITPQVHTGWRGACSSRSSSLSLHSSRWISLSRSPTIRWYSLVLALLTPYSTLIIESIAKRIAFSTTRTSSSRRCACRLPVVTEFILFYRLITFVQLMGHQKRCEAKKEITALNTIASLK